MHATLMAIKYKKNTKKSSEKELRHLAFYRNSTIVWTVLAQLFLLCWHGNFYCSHNIFWFVAKMLQNYSAAQQFLFRTPFWFLTAFFFRVLLLHRKAPSVFFFSTGPVSIPFFSEVVCFGVTIRHTLFWSSNSTRIARRINGIMYQLKLCRSLVSHEHRVRLIFTLIFSHRDCCCLTYFDWTNKQEIVIARFLMLA